MDSEHLRTPPTELELAEALDGIRLSMTDAAGKRIISVIRRLAFERDMLKDNRKAMEQAVLSAASSIIDNWDDWDAEAQQAAQQVNAAAERVADAWGLTGANAEEQQQTAWSDFFERLEKFMKMRKESK